MFVKVIGLKLINKIYFWCNNNPIRTIILVGLFIRLFVAVLYQHVTLYPDSEDYIYLAERLSYFNLSGYEGQRSPGYPLFLLLMGLSNNVVVLFQTIIGICTLVFMYKTCVLVGIKERISLLVTLAIIFYLPMVFFEFAILTETLMLFVIILIFYLFFGILQNKDSKRSLVLLLAALCGYLVMIKMFYVFLGILLFSVLVLNNRRFLKTVIVKYLLILLIPVFVFLGWSYVNKLNTGYFVSTTYYGFNIAQNCVWFADETIPEYIMIGDIYAKYRFVEPNDKEVAMTIWKAYPELQARTGLSFPDLSKELYDYSIATIEKNPVAYLEQVFISWRDFWKTSFYWEPYSFALPYADKLVLYICYIERIILQLIKILFVLLIPFNILIGLRKKKLTPSAIVSVIVLTASLLQAFVTYGTNSRFSFPFEILIILSVVMNVLQYKQCKLKQKTAP